MVAPVVVVTVERLVLLAERPVRPTLVQAVAHTQEELEHRAGEVVL